MAPSLQSSDSFSDCAFAIIPVKESNETRHYLSSYQIPFRIGVAIAVPSATRIVAYDTDGRRKAGRVRLAGTAPHESKGRCSVCDASLSLILSLSLFAMSPTVAVIGAGPLGLMALKNLREEGFEATCFDARPFIGGLWQHSSDKYLSVQPNTRFNSSKYRSAFSDYPFADDVDDWPTWSQMVTYLEGYANSFGLRKFIELESSVNRVDRAHGEWTLEIERHGDVREEKFDKVLVATGLFSRPKWPYIDNIDAFEGKTMHAIEFHNPDQFKDKNVLLVGLHATAQDVATSLEGKAKQVYASHKNGILMVSSKLCLNDCFFLNEQSQVSEYSANGATYDQEQTIGVTLTIMYLLAWFPRFTNWLFHKILDSTSAKQLPVPKSWNFSPSPAPLYTNPMVGDKLYAHMTSGFVRPVAAIRRIIGPRSIEMLDGTVLEDIDGIIWCTGYHPEVPFMADEFNPFPVIGQPGNMYRNTFLLHPDPEVRNSVAFLGQAFVPFPGFIQYEVMAMAIAQIWQGKSALPPYQEMKEWHKKWLDWRRYWSSIQAFQSTFYTAVVPFNDHLRWMDSTAGTAVFEHFDLFSSKGWLLWWQDRNFYNLCKNGLFSSAVWRLFETGKRKTWSNAREQISKDNVAAKRQIERRKAELKTLESKKDE